MPNNNFIPKESLGPNVVSTLPGDLMYEKFYQPETHNVLTGNKFRFHIERCPRLSYFCQRINLPSLSFGVSINSNPTGILSRRPGTSYVYEDLLAGFVVDEEMTNWIEIYNWMQDLGIGYKTSVEILNEHQKVSSAFIEILNSDYRPKIIVKFKNVFPVFLSGIDFDSSNTDANTILSTVKFAYTHYTVEVFENTP